MDVIHLELHSVVADLNTKGGPLCTIAGGRTDDSADQDTVCPKNLIPIS